MARPDGGRGRQDGFTLIEMVIVLLIIAILVTIGVPTMLGARERAQDKAVQSSLRDTLTTAKVIFTDAESYLDATPAALSDDESSLTFVDGATASGDSRTISVTTPDAQNFYAAGLSPSGTCFYLHDTASAPGAEYGSGSGACDGDTAAGGTVTYAASW